VSLILYKPDQIETHENPVYSQPSPDDLRTLFDYSRAYQKLENHITIHSNAADDNTSRAYMPSLHRFLKFLKQQPFVLDEIARHESQLRRRTISPHEKERHEQELIELLLSPSHGDLLPTSYVLTEYITGMIEDGLKASTVSRHLAPIKHFLNALATQETPPQLLAATIYRDGMELSQYIATQEARDSVYKNFIETQKQILAATQVKGPAKKAKENDTGIRLEPDEVNQLLEETAAEDTLQSERDALAMSIGFNTGLRVSGVIKVTRDSIKRRSNRTYSVKVRGKRGKYLAVSIPAHVVHRIDEHIGRWNEQFEPGDPRIIRPSDPVIQPLDRNGKPYEFTRARDGITAAGIRTIIQKRSAEILGKKVNPHDMRRTWAYIAYRHAGKSLEAVSRQLRHENIQTTLNYIGMLEDYDTMNIAEGDNGLTFDW
jgi:site-specific recombinase XerD